MESEICEYVEDEVQIRGRLGEGVEEKLELWIISRNAELDNKSVS